MPRPTGSGQPAGHERRPAVAIRSLARLTEGSPGARHSAATLHRLALAAQGNPRPFAANPVAVLRPPVGARRARPGLSSRYTATPKRRILVEKGRESLAAPARVRSWPKDDCGGPGAELRSSPPG